MTDITTDIHEVLRKGGYQTWLAQSDTTSVGFEDDSVMGFVVVFDTAPNLISAWTAVESDLLSRNSPNLRRAGDKAWNVYFVLIAIDEASAAERREAKLIEENLERTRKIVHVGIETRADVEVALLPLLPILSTPLLEPEDSVDRLRRRIAAIAPGIEGPTLDESVDPAMVVQAMGRNP